MRIVQSGVLSSNNSQGQREHFYAIALVVLCAVLFFYGLGSLPFIGPDEPRYAEVAREMLDSGDWITPRLGGLPWFEKPAMTYWLSCAGYALFGENELGARFGVALVASFGVLLLYGFGRKIRSAQFGYLSAASLVTCGLWPGFARGATFDLPLAVAMELALFSFFLWEDRQWNSVQYGERKRPAPPAEKRVREPQVAYAPRTAPNHGENGLWYVFSFALGLAVLSKGLVGIVLPFAIIGPYLLLTKRWKIVRRPRLIAGGIAVFLATTAIWYGPVIARNGREFINEFIIGHHIERYLTNKYRHPQPFYFFPLVVFLGSFPWSFHLVANVWESLKRGSELVEDRLRLLLLLWLIVPIVFFSFSGSKLPGYVLPIFPAIALMVGDHLEKWWKTTTPKIWVGLLTALAIITAGIGTVFVGRRDLGARGQDIWWMAAVAIGVAVLYLGLLLVRGGKDATLFLPFGLCVIVIATAHVIFPALANRESLRPLSTIATQTARPGERLVFFITPDHGINFYATWLPLRDTKSELVTLFSSDEIARLAQASQSHSILVVSKQRWVDGVMKSEKLKTEKLGEQHFNARCSPGCDWVLLRAQRKED